GWKTLCSEKLYHAELFQSHSDCQWSRVQLKMRAALREASISVVSEPRAVATGSYEQLSINTYFVSYCLIRSLPLAVLTRFVATLTFNYTLPTSDGENQ